MKIKKITYNDEKGQAWITITAETGEYLGVFHVLDKDLIVWLKENSPNKIKLEKEIK